MLRGTVAERAGDAQLQVTLMVEAQRERGLAVPGLGGRLAVEPRRGGDRYRMHDLGMRNRSLRNRSLRNRGLILPGMRDGRGQRRERRLLLRLILLLIILDHVMSLGLRRYQRLIGLGYRRRGFLVELLALAHDRRHRRDMRRVRLLVMAHVVPAEVVLL